MKWFVKCIKQYADFHGRARRREFWIFILITAIVSFCLTIPLTGMAISTGIERLAMDEPYDQSALLVALFHKPAFVVIYCISALWALFLIIPRLSVTTRRLHDVGRSGWFIFALFAIYFCMVCSLVAAGSYALFMGAAEGVPEYSSFAEQYWLFFLVLPLVAACLLYLALLVGGIWMLISLCMDGKPGENRWGLNPKEESEKLHETVKFTE